MLRRTFLVSALVLGVFAGGNAGLAQEVPSDTLLTVDHFLDFENVAGPAISPDGSRIIYTRRMVNKMEDRWESELWMVNRDGSKNRFLVKGSNAVWSPDGRRVAYLAKGEPKGTQIFVRWMDAEGAVTQVTRVTEAPASIKWSPDGKSIAFVMLVPDEQVWHISMPKPPSGARWTPPPRMVTRMHYRQDRVGFVPEGYTHLFIVPADGGTPRQLTHGKWNVGARTYGLNFGAGYDFTPDGKAIVFDGLMDGDADRKYRESHIYKLNLTTGETVQLTSTRGPWSRPLVSPDGKHITYTGFEWTPQTYRVTDLYVMNIDGSGPRNLTGPLDRDPGTIFWGDRGDRIYFTVDDRGTRNLQSVTLDGKMRVVTKGAHMLSVTSHSRNGQVAGVRSTPSRPSDVIAFALNSPDHFDQLTHVNDDVLKGIRLGSVEEVWYTSTGGARIQGWVAKPPSFDPGKRYPLILHIHGGPHAMYNVGFSYAYQNYAANGYVVLYTNPRGSTGYGTDFGNAIDNGYPSVDYEDLMAGVDTIVGRGYVDTDRMFVTGCSGGGVLSSWTIGHTDRFAAAAVRCPVTDWISFSGTTDITVWGYYRFDGYFWDNPDPWLEHSPLMYVGHVKTPTLLMTGVLDLRTPMGQTEEYYQALKTLNVPVVMLRFNKEFHGTSSLPSNFMRTQLYIMDWFRKHGGEKGRRAAE